MLEVISFALNAGQFLQGIPGAWSAAREIRGELDSGSHPGAVATYLSFQAGATEVILHLQLIADVGLPPKMAGGLWTWPTVWRSFKGLMESGERMTVAFGQVLMLGSSDVTEAAYEVSMAIGDAMKSLPVQGRRLTLTPELRDRIEVANRAMSVYLLAAREALNLDALPDPSETPGG